MNMIANLHSLQLFLIDCDLPWMVLATYRGVRRVEDYKLNCNWRSRTVPQCELVSGPTIHVVILMLTVHFLWRVE
jgi:hypothetical protein